MSTILPKGIVINSPGISGDIERKDREPLSPTEIAKFWRVYTTTKRRLLDPTAERLENLWWRIWGSRQRNLEGAKVALLFSEISDGHTFVPLRGPTSRYEANERGTTTISRNTGPLRNLTEITNEAEDESSDHQLVASSSKNAAVARPPPILKKSRGPSGSGPRPTARFVSPHSSEDEAMANSTSTASTNSHVVVRPPTPELKSPTHDTKSGASSSRKKIPGFTVVNAGNKRRVGTARRRSSQSSTSSETSIRSRSTVLKKELAESALPETPEEAISPGKIQNSSKVVEKSPLIVERRNGMKANKKSGNTAEESVQTVPGKKASQKSSITREQLVITSTNPTNLSNPGPSGTRSSIGPSQAVPRDEKQTYDVQAREHGFQPERKGSEELQEPELKKGHNLPALHQFPKDVDTKSAISLAPTYAAATGEIKFHEQPGSSTNQMDVKGKGREVVVQRALRSDLFAKRPVQPLTKAASALFGNSSADYASDGTPMSRSKSQLTLLLEKDRAKKSEQKGNESAPSPKSPKSKEPNRKNSDPKK